MTSVIQGHKVDVFYFTYIAVRKLMNVKNPVIIFNKSFMFQTKLKQSGLLHFSRTTLYTSLYSH